MESTGREKVLWSIAILMVLLYALIPVMWIASLSFKPPADIGDGKFIPETFTWDNYDQIFSTTLFNAVLRAGYDMGARRNHYYFIDRYPAGLDATVFKSGSGSVQTMSWTNDTANPVLIRGYKIKSGSKGYVRYDIYSVPTGRKVVISNPTIKNIRQATDTVQYTSSLAPGARKRIEYPVDGKDVWRTVTVYQGGTIIHQKT